jgi:hypothetical protein
VKSVRSKLIKSIAFAAILLLSTPSGVNSLFAAESASDLSNQFKHIVLECRGTRGGNGDVAASYLTALDLLRRHHFQGRMTFIVDDASARILSKLVGKTIQSGQSLFGNRIQVYRLSEIPKDLPTADLYLALANPSGSELFSHDLSEQSGPKHFEGSNEVGIPITNRTVRITQTVLGNTENGNSRNPNGLLRIGDEKLGLSPAGFATQEAGIYYDPVALGLRTQTQEQVRRFVLSSLGHAPDSSVREMVTNLIAKRTLGGSSVGLVYGITASSVKWQFEDYLKGLSRKADRLEKSYTLITPSGFSLDDIRDPALRRKITVLEKGDAVPLKATPGRIYVVKTGTLPHRMFVGLMALSEIPPVVAGDGALSAALALGKPFAMTRVDWNRRNIANLGLLLKDAGGSKSHALNEAIQEVYPRDAVPKLAIAQDLAGHKDLYSRLLGKIPSLTDNMLESARAALEVQDTISGVNEKISKIKDPVLRESLETSLLFRNAPESRVNWAKLLKEDPAQVVSLISQYLDSPRKMSELKALGFQELLLKEVQLASDSKRVSQFASLLPVLKKQNADPQLIGRIAEESLFNATTNIASNSALIALKSLEGAVKGDPVPYKIRDPQRLADKASSDLIFLAEFNQGALLKKWHVESIVEPLKNMGITLNPKVMSYASTHLTHLEWLKRQGVPEPEKVIIDFPEIKSRSIEEVLEPQVALLKRQGFDSIGKLIGSYPQILALSTSNQLDLTIEELKNWGLSRAEIEEAPKLLGADSMTLSRTWHFFQEIAHVAGVSKFDLANFTKQERHALILNSSADQLFQSLKESKIISPERSALSELTASEKKKIAEMYRAGKLHKHFSSASQIASPKRSIIRCFTAFLNKKVTSK